MVRGRQRRHERCERCTMLVPLCVCAACRPTATATRVIVVTHPREWRQQSNTGRIAALCLPSARVELARGRAHLAGFCALANDATRLALLHPSGDAKPLAHAADDPRTLCLLVPDGTWKQSARIARRLAAVEGVERVRVYGPSHRALRRRPTDEHLSTGEAIAAALETVGEADAAGAVRHGVRTMVDRSLYTRGKLSAEHVLGGITDEMKRAITSPPSSC